jgi:thiol:disulfide interchange protein
MRKLSFWLALSVWVGLLLGVSRPVFAQIERPVSWKFAAQPVAGTQEATLTFTVNVGGKWHIYSQFIEAGGPEPTSFAFTPSTDYELIGKVTEETTPTKAYEETFKMNIAYFNGKAVFSQKVRLKTKQTTIKGVLSYMACNDLQCLPPEEVEFSFPVKAAVAAVAPATSAPKTTAPTAVVAPTASLAKPKATASVPAKTASTSAASAAVTAPTAQHLAATSTPATVAAPTATTPVLQKPVSTTATAAVAVPDNQSLGTIFLAGFLGGLAALLMPCIFPMLPLTISYFTKQGKTRQQAVGQAAFYGISIILIYVALGLLVTVLFGADALNNLATNGLFNLFFFALLVVFAASFLGAFELTLPNSWVTKADTQADKGGLVGIFFMAATLALVSFSCTGPIIGTLLVQAASMGQWLGPALGMFGFALALSLPFTLFALFPSWLKALPKSGGWLNIVKVVLGFLELALALKFLSNVDLAYHWEWFDRELFLALWIIIFALLGLYLLGKIRFSHDSDTGFITLPRLFLAIVVLAFTAYLIPGLWGAPLKAVAAFLPPHYTQDFDLYTASLGGPACNPAATRPTRKYDTIFHAPLQLDAFFDYEEAVIYAKQVNKPLLLDFTGHACVNCRKMEATVWPDPQVLGQLRQDYVLVQLYVDDKTELPTAEQSVFAFSGKKIKTIGNKWSDFQAARFNANSQPYYVLLSPQEELLTTPQGANYEPQNFRQFLQTGLTAFAQRGARPAAGFVHPAQP